MSDQENTVEIYRTVNSVVVHWKTDYKLNLQLTWGIVSAELPKGATADYDAVEYVGTAAELKNAFSFIFTYNLQHIEGTDQFPISESFTVKLSDYTGEDSFVSRYVRLMKDSFARLGMGEEWIQMRIIKAFDPFFAALDVRCQDMVYNAGIVTQCFEQPIFLSSKDYQAAGGSNHQLLQANGVPLPDVETPAQRSAKPRVRRAKKTLSQPAVAVETAQEGAADGQSS